MAWDSQYTSQLASSFQGVAMNNMAYSQQIGMGGRLSGMPGQAGQQIMGGAMNRAYGIGAPLMTAGMGLMGLDPFSIGLKAGMGSFSGGSSLLGAGMAGMGAAGAMAGGLAIAGYAGNQIMAGAQQQQQLNGALRGNFNFSNPATGSQGFSTSQMGQIGGMMRHMTHESGRGGEVTGMSELTSLASNMGAMGMGNGVRDVQEFSRKFKEMVQTVKTIATEMGTSLQEAQQMMSSMKGSGVFRTSDQLKYAGQAKSMAFSGGLALSEVTSMGNIGAQISRSVGGLGKQGAAAGMNTIGQIGTATQMGVINEENIYNATGLTGAEGRQALATSSLSQAASFLRGGKGRRMLASMAGADGTLDEGSVQQLLSGGMSIGETMKHSNQNLSKIGRANFIRNEGRLRGAAMEKLGGFLPAMQMREWAESKGLDINEMDDRSMLFAQRQLGMGRDEADVAMRMAQRMPEIANSMKNAQGDQAYGDKLGMQRKTTGIEGIKSRFNQAREHVQGSLQKIGQDIFNEGSEMIERFMKKLAGEYETHMSAGAMDAYRSAKLGDTSSARNTFGIGGKMVAAGPSPLKGSSGAGGLFSQMSEGGFFAGRSDISKLQEAGYDTSSIKDDKSASERLQQITGMNMAARAPADTKYAALAADPDRKKWMLDLYGTKEFGAQRGEKRINSFGEKLQQQDPKLHAEIWQNATPEGRAKIMASMEAGGGVPDDAKLGALSNMPSDMRMIMMGKYATDKEKNEAFGAAFSSSHSDEQAGVTEQRSKIAAQVKEEAKASHGGSVIWASEEAGRRDAAFLKENGLRSIGGEISGVRAEGDSASNADTGAFLASKEGRGLATGLLSADAAERTAAQGTAQKRAISLATKGDKADALEHGELEVTRGLLAASEYADAQQKYQGDPEKLQAETSRISKQYGMSEGAIKKKLSAGVAVVRAQQDEDVLAVMSRQKSEAMATIDKYQKAGIATFSGGKLTLDKATEKDLQGIPGAAAAVKAMLGVTSAEYRGGVAAERGGAAGADEARAAMQEALGLSHSANDALAGMSVADKRKLAANESLVGTDIGAAVGASASRQDRLEKGVRRKGVGGAIADVLGVSLSKDDQKSLKGLDLKSEKGRDAAARMYARDMGVGDDKGVMDEIKKSISMASEGGKGISKSADALAGINGLKSVQEARQKKAEGAQAEKDPLMAKLVGIMEKMPDQIASKIGATTLNVKDMGKDVEKKP